jgi:hypothetical protein
MRTALLTIILALSLTLKSQTDDNDTTTVAKDSTKFVFPFDVMLGTKEFTYSFYDKLNTVNNFKILRPVNLIGVGYNGEFNVTRKYHYYGHYALLFVVPQDIIINNQKGKLTGFVFSCTLYGIDLLRKNKNIDLIISAGFNTGRLHIYQNDLLKQKNPFFSPMISFLPKFTFKKISFGLNIQYDYDISSTNWRRTNFSSSSKIQLNKFQQTGITTLLFVGIHI